MLLTAYAMGSLQLPSRVVMPPMTRSRAARGEVATALMAEYYAQRASAGLIISEGTQISPEGQGYAWTPGIYTPEQIAGWKLVTDAVHAKGGRIFAQLWHVGRISHVEFQAEGAAPVAPSAVPAEGVQVFVAPKSQEATSGAGSMQPTSAPRALLEVEITKLVAQYAQAARNAIEAGFDGVEIHAANGYLIEQFIDSHTNQRTDGYGGTLPKRLRFLKEVTQAVVGAIGAERVGVRLSPVTGLNDAKDETPHATYLAAAKLLDDLGVVYLHIADGDSPQAQHTPVALKEAIRMLYRGTLIYAGNYTPEAAEAALQAGWADLIGFGRPYMANPDLPERLAQGAALNALDFTTLFGGGAKGYTDYPTLQG